MDATRPDGGYAAASRPEISAGVPGGWACRKCGFRNRSANTLCGGTGRLGCNAPRDANGSAGATEAAPAEEELKWECHACKAGNEAGDLACLACKADRRYTGILKSIGGTYGFLACTDTATRFNRDVYVSKQVLDAAFAKETAMCGLLVSFQLVFNNDGQPNARSVKPLQSRRELQGDVDDPVYEGTVKYIAEDRGYGFIECPETAEVYGSDVFAEFEQLRGCCLGQPVTFNIRLGHVGGRPQVRRLSPAGPPPTETPTSCRSVAPEILTGCWQQRVLLFGEGDLSFSAAMAEIHPACNLDATVFLEEEDWQSRFPEHLECAAAFRGLPGLLRFGVDATTESCAGRSAVFFNFPHVSVREAAPAPRPGCISPSGELAQGFLENARSSADCGTLIVLGLWGRCDGRADTTLYGMDSHALVAGAIRSSSADGGDKVLVSALEDGYKRDGVCADYTFYDTYKDAGYSFRTNCTTAFEATHKEWHLMGCFVLRVEARS